MNGMIGCAGLIGIAVFIICLGLWSRRSRQGVQEFYQKQSLFLAQNPPQNVHDIIGALDPICFQGTVSTDRGATVPFYWWEWSTSSMYVSGNTAHSSLSCFLAISFPPGTVSTDFEETAIREKETKRSVWQFVKGIYALDTNRPIRTEKLPDGSFAVFWQVVQRPAVMEAKISWLKRNL